MQVSLTELCILSIVPVKIIGISICAPTERKENAEFFLSISENVSNLDSLNYSLNHEDMLIVTI